MRIKKRHMFATYCGFEVCYYMYNTYYTYKQLDNISYNTNRGILTDNMSVNMYNQFKQYFTNETNLTKFFTDSFLNKKSITLNNISKILSYHIFNIHPNTPPNLVKIHNTEYINNLLDIIKQKVELGTINETDDETEAISGHYMINKLNILHKPYIFYTIMYIIRKIFNIYMYIKGYKYIIDPATNIKVWIKYNKLDNIPLVFLHGFGMGILPYINKINNLSYNRTIIIPEIPNMSYDLYKMPPPSIDTIINVIYDILLKQNITQIDIMGHSFGTTILNAFQLKYPQMCNCKTYAEPVCFYIQQPQLTHIVYKSYRLSYNFIKYLLYIFVFRDQYIQYITKRCMFAEQSLINHFDKKTTIILAKYDYLLPTASIYDYMRTYYPTVNLFMRDGGHGSWVMDDTNDIDSTDL